MRTEGAISGGAAAARGCLIGGMRGLHLGELPLRGAASFEDGGGCIWGSCRCAGLLHLRNEDGGGYIWGSRRCEGLLDCRNEGAASKGAAAARGCFI